MAEITIEQVTTKFKELCALSDAIRAKAAAELEAVDKKKATLGAWLLAKDDAPIDLVVEWYTSIRTLKGNLKKESEDVGSGQEPIETWLLGRLTTLGLENMRTEHGTVFVSWKDSATIADWDKFLDWVLEENRYDYLDRRVNKTAVKAKLEEELQNYEAAKKLLPEGELPSDTPAPTPPPGVNYTKFKGVSVRKK